MFSPLMITIFAVLAGLAMAFFVVLDAKKALKNKKLKQEFIQKAEKLLTDVKIIHNRIKAAQDKSFIGIDSKHELTPTLENARFLLQLNGDRGLRLFNKISQYYADYNNFPDDKGPMNINEITQTKNEIVYGIYNAIDHVADLQPMNDNVSA